MSWFLRKFFKYLFLFLILCLIGIGIFLATFDLNRYRGMITSRASAALGRPVEIQEASLKISIIPTVKLKGVKVGNATGFGEEPFVQIEEMEATLSLPALIKEHKIDFMDFYLGATSVHLQEKDGQNNWTFAAPRPASAVKTADTAAATGVNYLETLNIGTLKITRLQVSYVKGTAEQKMSVTDFSMQQLKVFSGRFFYQNYAADVSGVLNNVMDLVLQKPDYLFNLAIKAMDAEIKVSGRIGDIKTFSNLVFDVTAQGADLNKTIAATGEKVVIPAFLGGAWQTSFLVQGDLKQLMVPRMSVSLADGQITQSGSGAFKNLTGALTWSVKGDVALKDGSVARQIGLKPLSLSWDASGDGANITLSSAALTAGKTDVVVQAGIQLQAIPKIDGSAVSEYFDLNDLIFDEGLTDADWAATPKTNAPKGSLFSDQKIDFSVLKKVNGKMNFDLAHVRLPSDMGSYAAVKAMLSLDKGVMTVKPLTVAMMNGQITGSVQVNAGVTPATLKADLRANTLNLDAIKAMSSYLKGGKINATIDLSSAGQSVRQLAAGLNGRITAEVSTADITSRNFTQLLKATDLFPGKEQNNFSYSEADVENKLICGAVNMMFKNGVADLKKNIAVETSSVNFVVSGLVNLKDETLSVSMTPSLGRANPKVNQALELTQNLVVEGAFDNLKINTRQSIQNTAVAAAQNVAAKLLDKQMGKGGAVSDAQNTNRVVPYALCEAALGRRMVLRADNEETARPVEQPAQPTVAVVQPEPMSPKDQLKQQLFDSLSQVLKKK